MKNIIKEFKWVFLFVFTFICMCNATELTYSPFSLYSHWSTYQTGNYGEISHNFYKYRTVTSWNTNLVESTNYPTFYKKGTYETNCRQETACNYTGAYDRAADNSGCAPHWCPNGSTDSWYCKCCADWGCQFGSDGGGMCYQGDLGYTTTVCDTRDGYYTPKTWSDWQYSYNSIEQTNERQVDGTVTFYSYQWQAYLTIGVEYNGNKYDSSNMNTYGTFDVYIDDKIVADNVTYYNNLLTSGQTWSVGGIEPATGYSYKQGDPYIWGRMLQVPEDTGDIHTYVVFEDVPNYTLTACGNGGTLAGNFSGTSCSSVTVTIGSGNYSNSGAGSYRTGYTYNGLWTATSGGTQIFKPDGSNTNDGIYWLNNIWQYKGDLTLYAQWSINNYTLTYNANGGSVSPASKSVTYGAQYGTLPTPSRTGYTFAGWYTAASGGSQVSSITTMDTSNTTIYAHWNINSYYLDLNGYLDGVTNGGLGSYGTADVYIDDVLKANDVSDFYQKINYGQKWEIKDIKATTGHTYNGVYSGSLTGTMGTSNVTVSLNFATNYQTYTMDVLYNGNSIVQSANQITSGTNYTLKSIKFCKKQTDTTNYSIGIGENFQDTGIQTGTSGCTIIK